MTDHTPFAQPSDPTAIRTPTPLPALGFVLAAGWLLLASVWAFVTSHRAAGFEGQLQFLRAANALGVIVVVVPPLLLRQIPALLRRQAMPFLVLAGALTLVELVVGGSGTAPLLVVATAVLYVIGWLRLRGRDPKLMLVALATPVLYGLGMFASAMLVMQFDAPVLGYGAPGRTAAWLLIQALLMGALPVCLPLFIAGFVRQRDASDPTVDAVSAVSPGTFPVADVGMNAFAMASLVLGLTGGSIIAVVFGHIARSQIRRTKETGGGLAIAGLVLGYVAVVAGVAALMGTWFVGILFLKVVG